MRIFCVYFTKLESFKRIFLNNILFLSQYKINILVARQINIFLTKHFLFLYLLFCNIQEKIYKPPNSTTRRFPSYLLLTLLLYLLIIFYLPRCTLPDFFLDIFPGFLAIFILLSSDNNNIFRTADV